MTDSFEASLRRAMEALGRVVERTIGKAKLAKVQVRSRSGVQPILSLESQLPFPRIRELIEASIQRVMRNALPDLKGGAALEVGEGPVSQAASLLGARAVIAVGVEISGGSTGRQGDLSRGFVVRGQVARLPLSGNLFNYVLARLATAFQGDMGRALREIGRVIKPGGQGVVIDYHPFGLYARRGTARLRPTESQVRKIEDYYRLARQAGIRIVDVREAYVDETMRTLFKEDEIQAYRNLKGTPLLIFLFVYKPKGQ